MARRKIYQPKSVSRIIASYVTSFQSRASSIAEFVPQRGTLNDLTDILNILLQTDVPGPSLVRLSTEFNCLLGRGAQFEVLGLSSNLSKALTHVKISDATGTADASVAEPLRQLPNYAIKRAIFRQGSTQTSSTSEEQRSYDSALALGFQLHCAKTEIEKLCYPPFRNHPNIVKLLGWGLDLDILEDERIQTPRIPLLLLERAHCDLAQFLKRHAKDGERLQPAVAEGICMDIGCGLELLHGENIYHGDLKPENVLIFKNEGDSGAEWKWTAKLCDFGLAATASQDSTQAVEYRGTEGWRPPEADSFQLIAPQLVSKCDVFAYGLIVWTIFTGRHESPIRERSFFDQASKEHYRYAAFGDIQLEFERRKIAIRENIHRFIASNHDLQSIDEIEASRIHAETQVGEDIHRVWQALDGALKSNPTLRHTQPWIYLNTPSPPKTNDNVKENLINELVHSTGQKMRDSLKAVQSSATQASQNLKHSFAYAKQVRLWLNSFVRLSKTALLQNIKMQPRIYHEQYLFYTKDLFLHKRWDINGLSTFNHAIGHHDLRPLMRDLLECVEVQLSEFNLSKEARQEDPSVTEIKRALARLRSRFSCCCWDQAADYLNLGWGLRSNVLRRTLYVTSDLSFLAWLCRGEIGKFELESLRSDPKLIWFCIFDPSLDLPARLARFILLWESGCYIQDIVDIGNGPRSAFYHMLSMMLKSDYEAEGTFELIRHVKRIAGMSSTPLESRFFLTGSSGQIVDDGPVENTTFRTTALHEAVELNSYMAVEYLLRSGFAVNALDYKGKTAYERAVSSPHVHLQDQEEKNQRDRIIVLLQQGKIRPSQSALPRGWEPIDIESLCHEKTIINPSIPHLSLPAPTAPINPTPTSKFSKRKPSSIRSHLSSSSASHTNMSRGSSNLFPSIQQAKASYKTNTKPQDSDSRSAQVIQRHLLAPTPRKKPSAYPYALHLLGLPRWEKSRSKSLRKPLHSSATVSSIFKFDVHTLPPPELQTFKYIATVMLLFHLPLYTWFRLMRRHRRHPTTTATNVITSTAIAAATWDRQRYGYMRNLKVPFARRWLRLYDHLSWSSALSKAHLHLMFSVIYPTRSTITVLSCMLYCYHLAQTARSWIRQHGAPKRRKTSVAALSNYIRNEHRDEDRDKDMDKKDLPPASNSYSNHDLATPPTAQHRQLPLTVYYERHTESVTFTRPRISILEHQRLALGLQVLAQSEHFIRSESQLFRLDLVPFINRRAARNLQRQAKKKNGGFESSMKVVYDDEWYLNDSS